VKTRLARIENRLKAGTRRRRPDDRPTLKHGPASDRRSPPVRSGYGLCCVVQGSACLGLFFSSSLRRFSILATGSSRDSNSEVVTMYSSRPGRIGGDFSCASGHVPGRRMSGRTAWECCPDAAALPLRFFRRSLRTHSGHSPPLYIIANPESPGRRIPHSGKI